MRPLRGWMLFVAACYIISGALLAQQRFTSGTSLLVLDVSVLDRDGNPVPDLRPEDLVVTLNGQTQPVRTMVFLTTYSTKANATRGGGFPVSPSPAAPASSSSEPDPRLFVVMVDDLSIAPTQSKGLLVAAERFVDSIPPRDWVGLATTSGMETVNPSADRAALLAKLRRMFGRMNDPRRQSQTYVGLMEALMAVRSQSALRDILDKRCGLSISKSLGQLLAESKCASDIDRQTRHNATFARRNARDQLDAYIAVINAMAPAPGVKQLVVLTDGLAVAPQDSASFIPVAKAAATAGVQITMMMEEPDDIDLSFSSAGDLAHDQRQMLKQVQTLAEVSGGQFFRVIGQPDRFYQRVLTSASAVYRIGVDLPTELPPDGQYTVTVAVTRPGVKAFASRYAVPPPPAVASSPDERALTPDEQMTRAVETGQPLYAVPVQMSAEVVRPEGETQLAILVSIEVPGDTPEPLSGMFGMIGPDGRLQSGRRNLIRSADGESYRLEFLVRAVAATYELRFAIVDGSGAVGAVAQKVVVQ
ncbi:MAG: VWA domain-containing protein [Vicinamibacterales bacterium]